MPRKITISWFKHCKTEHKALRRAIELGDTHAAREYRKAFNHVKRRWKRYYSKAFNHVKRRWKRYYSNKLLSRMRDDIRHNPRRFWLYFKGAKRCEFVQDLVSWSQYWESLFGGGEQTWLQQGAADVAALVSELGLDTTLGAKHKASKLNEPIELDEMAVVFNKLKRGKAAGPDGIRAEFLKDAVVREFEDEDGSHPVFRNVLLEPVHAVINAFFESGDPPVSWSEAAISAVFKKGDPTCKDNYGGIAVGNVFGKVFSMVLEQRLSKWSEEHGHRAQAQAGFRKGMRTTDQLFILRHVIDKYRLQKKPLFCCFVDFKKAYDSVDRRLLLQRLASLGIWGTMLTSIAAMYRNVPSLFLRIPNAYSHVTQVLPGYLGLDGCLKARLICKQWRSSFGAHVQHMQLCQPKTEAAARSLGRKLSAAFPSIQTLSVELYCEPFLQVSVLMGGSSSSSGQTPEEKAAAGSAAALLRPIGKLTGLRKLQLTALNPHCFGGAGPFPYKVPLQVHLLPKLQTLDLSRCCHQSSDLLVIARHLQHLQQLTLFHPSFTKVSGSCVYLNRYVLRPSANYQAQHLAALAQLPQLQLLETPLPVKATLSERLDCESGLT